MTDQECKRIRDWISERDEIVSRYKRQLDAELIDGIWYVLRDGKLVRAVDFISGDMDVLSLLVNHAYLQGAADCYYSVKGY